MTWDSVAARYGTDKAYLDGNGHGYMESYERALGWRTVRSVLEIGVAGGKSLSMWAELFPDAHVVGVDIHPDCAIFAGDRISIVTGDATDPKTIDVLRERGPYDLIVDDGSHDPDDILATLAGLYPALTPGGLYVIEDTYCEGAVAPWVPYATGAEFPIRIVASEVDAWAKNAAHTPWRTGTSVAFQRYSRDHNLDCGPCLIFVEGPFR